MVTKKRDVKYNKKYTTIIHNNANPTTTWFNVSNFRSTPSFYTNRSPDRQYCSKPDISDIRKQFARSFLHPAHVRAKTLSYRNGKRARPAWRDARPLTLLPTSLYLSFGARRETEKDRGTVAWVIMSLSREPDNVVVETRWSDCTGSRAGRDTFSDSLSLSPSPSFSLLPARNDSLYLWREGLLLCSAERVGRRVPPRLRSRDSALDVRRIITPARFSLSLFRSPLACSVLSLLLLL